MVENHQYNLSHIWNNDMNAVNVKELRGNERYFWRKSHLERKKMAFLQTHCLSAIRVLCRGPHHFTCMNVCSFLPPEVFNFLRSLTSLCHLLMLLYFRCALLVNSSRKAYARIGLCLINPANTVLFVRGSFWDLFLVNKIRETRKTWKNPVTY